MSSTMPFRFVYRWYLCALSQLRYHWDIYQLLHKCEWHSIFSFRWCFWHLKGTTWQLSYLIISVEKIKNQIREPQKKNFEQFLYNFFLSFAVSSCKYKTVNLKTNQSLLKGWHSWLNCPFKKNKDNHYSLKNTANKLEFFFVGSLWYVSFY